MFQDLLVMLRADLKMFPTLREELKIIEMVIESDPYL